MFEYKYLHCLALNMKNGVVIIIKRVWSIFEDKFVRIQKINSNAYVTFYF
ncbi:hypothetical protein BCM0100_2018 [Bacillus cereus]|nr:hypothetical protein BCM0100_2018 [Bacillus cereus]